MACIDNEQTAGAAAAANQPAAELLAQRAPSGCGCRQGGDYHQRGE